MAKQDNDYSLDEFAKLVWNKKLEGLPVPELNLSGEVTQQEVENILLKYAYLQIVNPEARGEYSQIHFTRSSSGWVIFNYGNAMAASPGEDLFQHGSYITTEDGPLQRVCTGRGTITLKAINTTADMARIAKEEAHWESIYIVNGHLLMRWGIWKAAQELNIPVTNYVPSKAEEAKYQLIQRLCPKTLVMHPITPDTTPSK